MLRSLLGLFLIAFSGNMLADSITVSCDILDKTMGRHYLDNQKGRRYTGKVKFMFDETSDVGYHQYINYLGKWVSQETKVKRTETEIILSRRGYTNRTLKFYINRSTVDVKGNVDNFIYYDCDFTKQKPPQNKF